MRTPTLALFCLGLACSKPEKEAPDTATRSDSGEDTGTTDTGDTDTGGSDTGDSADTAHTGETGDTAPPGAPPPAGGHFCAAAGTMTGGGYVAVTCTAPVDAAPGRSASGGGYTWQPGPVVRLGP